MKDWFKPHPDSLLGKLGSPTYLRWESLANLAWVIALFIAPLADPRMSWTRWLLPTAASAPLYLYLHFRVYTGPYRLLPWYAGAMAALGFIVWPFNGVALGYVVSAAMCLAYLPSLRRWLVALVLLAIPTAIVGQLQHVSPWIMLVVGLASVVSGFGHFLRMNNHRKDAALRLSQEEVRRLATLAERERIGRDLHDLLGHTLSLVTIKSELARRLALVDPERAQREMEEVERVARHALAEVRTAVTGMRRGDLAAELVSARLMLEASGVGFNGALPEGTLLPPQVEAPLALVLREAVTNIHRHAKAQSASVTFQVEKGHLQMQVSDDGCGGLSAHGNGVSGMRERVRALGGNVQIDSPPRRGTVLTVRVPLDRKSVPDVAADAPPTELDNRSAA
ncbi:sensor histidine kinase [Dyella telluris]|uniref:Sensor histidine kinase n=1 Tax=Dyella telluris TaxID=2763498 RepID=A0A7G8Q0X8_9GAMM|nr:sensor histidine kinase [Dyella telluris]QNK00436.1 sensor histidine kinase [Dyella telluris]